MLLASMPDLIDILHREWPVIKAAPYSFLISIFVVATIMFLAFQMWYRKRLSTQLGASGYPDSSRSNQSQKTMAILPQLLHQ